MGQIGSLWYNIGAKTSDFQKGLTDSKSKLNQFGNSFQKVTGITLGTVGAFTLAYKALDKLVKFTQESILQNDKYISSIVDRSKVTKDSLEETSRLYQAADDKFLDSATLEQSLLAAKRKGIDVSVKGLQNLSEQYLKTGQDTKFLTDTFGRNGAEMYKLMSLGSSGIRSQMDAISDSLIVTEQSKQLTYEYKESLDALNDSLEGIKYTVAQNTIPSLTDLNIVMTYLIEKLDEAEIKENGFIKTLVTGAGVGNNFAIIMSLAADKISGYTAETELATSETNKLSAAISGVPSIKGITSRGSIYDETYQGGSRGNHGSIYDTGIDAGGAAGLNMIVPAGYPNDSYRIGASTGEEVNIGRNTSSAGNDKLLQEIQGMRRELNRLPLALRDAYLFAVKNV